MRLNAKNMYDILYDVEKQERKERLQIVGAFIMHGLQF